MSSKSDVDCSDHLTSATSFYSQSSDSPLPSVTSTTEEETSTSDPCTNTSNSTTIPPSESTPGLASSGTSGRISPSAVCFQRKMSTALVATEDADHEFLDGRPKVFLEHCPTPQPTKSKVPLLPRGSVPSIVRRAQTVPIDDRVPDYALHPPPLRVEHWAEPPATAFKVRGRNYLRDGGIKVTSESSVFRLLTVDLIHTPSPVFTGMCSQPNERIQMALKRERETGVRELPEFVFAVNYYVPAGDPGFHWVAYFGVDDASVLKDPSTPLGRLCHPFFFGPSDTFRTSVFKLIPRIVEGNFVVRKAVGSKPSILGRKLKQYYVQHDRYFELIVDIGSDSVADRIVKVALGAAKSLVVDMMFVLEGNNETTLPERILGGARMQYLDLKRKDLQRRSSSGP